MQEVMVSIVDKKKKLLELPDEFMLRNFDGQTVVSLSLADFDCYEKFMHKFIDSPFNEDESDKKEAEHVFKTKIMCIFELPTQGF